MVCLKNNYSFAAGNPVPDGMAFVQISVENAPSNISVFKADDIAQAMVAARAAFRHGAQAAVWDTDHYHNVSREIGYHTNRRHDIGSVIRRDEQTLAAQFSAVMSAHRVQSFSQFFPHCDQVPQSFADEFMSFHNGQQSIRTLINFDGVGTILFRRNIILADQLNQRIQPTDVTAFGTAFIAPTGSVTFLLNSQNGLARAAIHSFPHVPKSDDAKPVREIGVIDCQNRAFN